MSSNRLFVSMCLVAWLALAAIPAAFAIGGWEELSTALALLKTTFMNYLP